MAAIQFSKEISRFALMSKKECLQDLLTGFSEETDGYKAIQSKIDDLDQLIAKVKSGGKRKGGAGGDPDTQRGNFISRLCFFGSTFGKKHFVMCRPSCKAQRCCHLSTVS